MSEFRKIRLRFHHVFQNATDPIIQNSECFLLIQLVLTFATKWKNGEKVKCNQVTSAPHQHVFRKTKQRDRPKNCTAKQQAQGWQLSANDKAQGKHQSKDSSLKSWKPNAQNSSRRVWASCMRNWDWKLGQEPETQSDVFESAVLPLLDFGINSVHPSINKHTRWEPRKRKKLSPRMEDHML